MTKLCGDREDVFGVDDDRMWMSERGGKDEGKNVLGQMYSLIEEAKKLCQAQVMEGLFRVSTDLIRYTNIIHK